MIALTAIIVSGTVAAVYAPATFYWTGRPRQRHIRFQSAPQACIPTAGQHSPKRGRDIAIGGEDGTAHCGSGTEVGTKASGISISEVCGKLIQRYIVKSYAVTERGGRRAGNGGAREGRRISPDFPPDLFRPRRDSLIYSLY